MSVQEPVARVAEGELRGVRTESGLAFRGVPYAAAPVGPRRFRPPVAHAPWDGVRPCLTAAAAAHQVVSRASVYDRCFRQTPQSEDCLWLSVWTPTLRPEEPLPVLVWFHGGAFVHGTAGDPLYDGGRLATRGCVVVTVNHRLGVLGMLDLRCWDDDGAVNLALQDQAVAIAWVRENAAAFGGDAERITLFGESVGGTSVLVHLGARHGLAHRGIAQSASSDQYLTAEVAQRIAGRVLGDLGVRPGDRVGSASVPIDRILAVQQAVLIDVWTGTPAGEELVGDDGVLKLTPFLPVVDGYLVPGSITAGLADSHSVELLLGTNSTEALLYELTLGAEGADAWIRGNLERCRRVGTIGPIAEATTTYAQRHADHVLQHMETDRYFRRPTLRAADTVASAGGDAYLYLLDADAAGGLAHLGDVCLTFGHLGTPLAALLGVSGQTGLSARVQETWIEFARTGSLPAFAWRTHVPGASGSTVLASDKTSRDETADATTRAIWR